MLTDGAPLVDAVRLDTGKYATEKAAVLNNLSHVVAQDIRRCFENNVEKHLKRVALDKTKCTSWKRLLQKLS